MSKLSMFLKLRSISGFWQISEKDQREPRKMCMADVNKGLSKKDARVAEHKMRLEDSWKHEMLRKAVEDCGSSNRTTKDCKGSNLNDDEEDNDDDDNDGNMNLAMKSRCLCRATTAKYPS